MDGLNKVMLIGNVGQDPEMRYTPQGSPVTSFRVAVNRSFTGQDGERKSMTDWFTVVCWSKLAETCNEHLSKGRKVYVEGRLQTRSWEGADGQKRYVTEVVASSVLFLDRPPAAALPEGGLGEEIDADDLPFE